MSSPLIAFFLPNLAGGGAERVAVNLAGDLMRRGYAVDFVLARAWGQYLDDVPAGVRLLDLHARRTLTALPGLVRYMRREKPCTLISVLDHANLIALWSKILARTDTKVIIDNQNHLSTSIRHTRKLQEHLYPYLLRVFQSAATAIVSVSNGAADDLARLTGIRRERITVIHNPVVVPAMDTLRARPLDHPWFSAGEPPVILAAARLTVQKDFPTLLRAFSLLRRQRPARLVILGEGERRADLLALAEDLGIEADLDLHGFVKNPHAFMSRCAVFVLSSAWEGFGNVLVEALACGAQVVSTDCPSGPAEILENGKYGRLTPVGDPQALAEAIQEALDHPLPARMLQSRAAAFSVEKATEKYLQVVGCA